MIGEEIEKVLKCCGKPEPDCENCPYTGEAHNRRCYEVAKVALDYVNRLKEKVEHGTKTIGDMFTALKERDKKISNLSTQVVLLEQQKDKEVKKAKKTIFVEMYKLVKEVEEDHVVTVSSREIKDIAKRYGVEVNK